MLSRLYRAPKRALVVSVVVAAVCATVGSVDASAAKGGKGGGGTGSTGSGLTLSSETIQNSPNTAAPLWCLNEDDLHKRMWTGSLNGSFTATEQLCGTSDDYANGMYWDGGGIGFQAEIWVNGTLDDVTITSPDGTSHHGVLVDSSTSKGATTKHYQVCYTPQYSISSGASGRPMAGGTWQITASGNFTNGTFATTARMTTVAYQQAYCPSSEQNLTA
jgi:hypothetical protein